MAATKEQSHPFLSQPACAHVFSIDHCPLFSLCMCVGIVCMWVCALCVHPCIRVCSVLHVLHCVCTCACVCALCVCVHVCSVCAYVCARVHAVGAQRPRGTPTLQQHLVWQGVPSRPCRDHCRQLFIKVCCVPRPTDTAPARAYRQEPMANVVLSLGVWSDNVAHEQMDSLCPSRGTQCCK